MNKTIELIPYRPEYLAEAAQVIREMLTTPPLHETIALNDVIAQLDADQSREAFGGLVALDEREHVIGGMWWFGLDGQALYERWNFWVVFTAGFTPIPYKLFTITAGVFHVHLGWFTLASLVGRAGRFFLIAALLYFFGPPIRRFLDRYLGWLTIAFVLLLFGGFLLLRYVL